MHEITAHRVPPGHVAPRVAERVVLVEEVILALVVDEPVRVVHPVLRGREMELRAIRLAVRRRLRTGSAWHCRQRDSRADGSDDGPVTAHVCSLSSSLMRSTQRTFSD